MGYLGIGDGCPILVVFIDAINVNPKLFSKRNYLKVVFNRFEVQTSSFFVRTENVEPMMLERENGENYEHD
jgi:hypothetical protein